MTVSDVNMSAEHQKYRAEVTKGAGLRFISHLDYAALFQRAICRAKLPAAYSEGFNPHMKMSFASALPLGVRSESEYMDFELKEPLQGIEVYKKLGTQLPPEVKIKRIAMIHGKHKALMAEMDMAEYEVILPYSGTADDVHDAISRFKHAGEALFHRVTPKKTRDIDAKKYVRNIEYHIEGDRLLLNLAIASGSTGSIKPGEVLNVLNEQFSLYIEPYQADICRTAIKSGGRPLIELV